MNPLMSEVGVPIAVEDKFVIITIGDARTLCPGGDVASVLGQAIELSKLFLGDLIPLFDLRGLRTVYSDVQEFVEHFEIPNTQILLNRETAAHLGSSLKYAFGYSVLIAESQTSDATVFHPRDSFDGLEDLSRHNPLFKLACKICKTLNQYVLVTKSDNEIERIIASKNLARDVKVAFKNESVHEITAHDFAYLMPKIAKTLHRYSDGWSPASREARIGTSIHELLRVISFLKGISRNSLLIEFVMTSSGEEITCAPYHANAINNVEFPGKSSVLVGRPGVVADRTRAIFSTEVKMLENLINSKSTREHDLQKFFEAHPAFLKGLNYSNIYPQVVLQRDDGTSLRPDFILEPYDDAWCDILDIKLPGQSLIVGRNDRATLAAGIHEVAAQLREYAAFFEQDRYRKWVREKYGLRVYRPRLIAVVGRDMKRMAEEEVRRAMTAYEDLQIMTFDQLVTHAKSRLLI